MDTCFWPSAALYHSQHAAPASAGLIWFSWPGVKLGQLATAVNGIYFYVNTAVSNFHPLLWTTQTLTYFMRVNMCEPITSHVPVCSARNLMWNNWFNITLYWLFLQCSHRSCHCSKKTQAASTKGTQMSSWDLQAHSSFTNTQLFRLW